MKKVFYILFLSLFLFSCADEVDEIEEIVKKDFFIETKQIDEFSVDLSLKKTGKVYSSQDIKLSSQASGRVKNIYVKEGDQIWKGAIIARLEDNIANYGLALESAQNALDKAKINYETTESQLNKSISDIEINLANSKIDEISSSSSLELEKIKNSITKTTIDYENLKISNTQVINGYKNSGNTNLTSFSTFTDDIIDFADRLLGVSADNNDKNDKFEDYLGAKDSSQKKTSIQSLKDLISYRENDLTRVEYNFDGSSGFDANFLIINEGYDLIADLLRNLEKTLDNSIPSLSNFSDSTISSYKGNISSFWISYNGYDSGYVGLKNSINSFLDTYKNSEESLLKQISLLESDEKIYVRSLDVKLEIDEGTLDEAIRNKELSLRQLDTYITDANIAYKQALNNYNKLAISSPISGVVGEILIDIGQEVAPGIGLFSISNNTSNEIAISFNKNELDLVNVGNIATVSFDGETHTGSIYSISNIADENLKYISRIAFNDGVIFIGDIVDVQIPFTTERKLLPVNIMKMNDSGKGVVNILIDGEIHKKTLSIGNIYGDKVEITEEVNPEVEFITTNIDNFDVNKFNLKLKEPN